MTSLLFSARTRTPSFRRDRLGVCLGGIGFRFFELQLRLVSSLSCTIIASAPIARASADSRAARSASISSGRMSAPSVAFMIKTESGWPVYPSCGRQPAASGRAMHCGCRQSVPSDNIEDIAGVSRTTPSCACDQTNLIDMTGIVHAEAGLLRLGVDRCEIPALKPIWCRWSWTADEACSEQIKSYRAMQLSSDRFQLGS